MSDSDGLKQAVDGCSGSLVRLLTTFGTIITVTMYRAYVVLCFYRWFVVPFGGMELGFAHVYALTIMVSLLHGSPVKMPKEAEKKDISKEFWYSLGVSVWATSVSLVMGFLFSKFI